MNGFIFLFAVALILSTVVKHAESKAHYSYASEVPFEWHGRASNRNRHHRHIHSLSKTRKENRIHVSTTVLSTDEDQNYDYHKPTNEETISRSVTELIEVTTIPNYNNIETQDSEPGMEKPRFSHDQEYWQKFRRSMTTTIPPKGRRADITRAPATLQKMKWFTTKRTKITTRDYIWDNWVSASDEKKKTRKPSVWNSGSAETTRKPKRVRVPAKPGGTETGTVAKTGPRRG